MFYIVFTEDRYVELKHFIHNVCILLFYIFFLFIRMCVCNIYFLEMRYIHKQLREQRILNCIVASIYGGFRELKLD